LSGFIVQLTGNPGPLVFLSNDGMAQEFPAQRLTLL